MRSLRALILAAGLLEADAAPPPAATPRALVHSGMSDTSGGVAVGADRFVAADDEKNVLCVFRSDRDGPALQRIALDAMLGIDPKTDKHPEADIEAGTWLGGRTYWITSHGRSKDGKWRPNRQRLLAIALSATKDGVSAKPAGKAYANLLRDLAEDSRLAALGLPAAIGPAGRKVEALAPKDGGLNIEGLCASADPGAPGLLIGFRSPLVEGKALVVPLLNPAAVVEGQSRAKLGRPILLKLHARREGKPLALGIRDIQWAPRVSAYLIVAGPVGEKDVFGLFRWSGKDGQEPVLLARATEALGALKQFTPEALIVYPDTKRVQILSDCGSVRVKVADESECLPGTFSPSDRSCEAKHLKDDARKTFQSVWLDPE